MKKQVACFLLLMMQAACIFSQRIDAVWPIGYDCCLAPYFSTADLDFRSGSLLVNPVVRSIDLSTTNVSAADSSGNLLFVSNGAFIFNAANDTMLNGNNLNPGYYRDSYQSGGLNLIQGMLVIPSLTDPNQYILFHSTSDDYINTGISFYLYSTVIDMTLDGGLGGVVSKNNVLFTDSMVPGRITASRHANGRDWWIFVHKVYGGDVFEFLYTPFGFYGPWIQSLGTYRNIGYGHFCFNPQGTKVAYYDAVHGLDVADFDRCTGNFSNQYNLTINDSDHIAGGVAFSSSGRYLYVCNRTHMYQFDTWQSNLDSTKILLGVYDNFVDTAVSLSFPTAFYLPQLAPDNKIYISAINGVRYLHVINYPDSAGLAADFCQHCISLPGFNSFTIPNFPNYLLGADSISLCDTIFNGIEVQQLFSSPIIFPNPASSTVRIYFKTNKKFIVQIYDILGKEILKTEVMENGIEREIDVRTLPNGIYQCMIKEEETSVVHFEKIIVSH
ncbi:MAG: T9SS type A sorting domain-containing protein [Bacteroidetes bacterium]|nr:T9SS type A sorting domain-containing protein [Bacteroidota bacterium]MBP7306338.1 T9SS type A sorting domain-containing protein [Saprospiraceae bacterium]